MFSAALIVFRESLEARALRGHRGGRHAGLAGRSRWLATGVGLGVIGAALLALLAGRISEALTASGGTWSPSASWRQPWPCCCGTACGCRPLAADGARGAPTGQQRARGAAPALGADRRRGAGRAARGAETVLFVAGSATDEGGALAPGVLGAGTVGPGGRGFGLAGLCRAEPHPGAPPVHGHQCADRTAGGLDCQPADACPGPRPACCSAGWTRSGHLAPAVAGLGRGHLAHALVGYDAQPSGAQFMAYVAVITLIVVGTRLQQTKTR